MNDSNCYQAQLAAAILESMVDFHPEVGMRGKFYMCICIHIYTCTYIRLYAFLSVSWWIHFC
jgi:hypothetical protein